MHNKKEIESVFQNLRQGVKKSKLEKESALNIDKELYEEYLRGQNVVGNKNDKVLVDDQSVINQIKEIEHLNMSRVDFCAVSRAKIKESDIPLEAIYNEEIEIMKANEE